MILYLEQLLKENTAIDENVDDFILRMNVERKFGCRWKRR